MKIFYLFLLSITTLFAPVALGADDLASEPWAGPYLTNGVKIGEITTDSAIVWTRLARNPTRNTTGYGLRKGDPMFDPDNPEVPLQQPDPKPPVDVSVENMHGEVPGHIGQVRLTYWEEGNSEGSVATEWKTVVPDRDFTHHFYVENLKPKTKYQYRVEARPKKETSETAQIEGRFRTMPQESDPARVLFTVTTGTKYEFTGHRDGYRIYPVMGAMDPDFFVHTGDIMYMSNGWIEKGNPAAGVARGRYQWHRNFAYPFVRDFHKDVPTYFIKDDHDVGRNDCWIGNGVRGLSVVTGIALFREQLPSADPPYRTARWGSDLQIWMVEGRDYRSPNTDPDGPDKTIWGAEQKEWLKKSILASDAPFRILISPTPIVGPDRDNKKDNHSNSNWTHEGDEIRHWLRDHAPDVISVCGDRHWQYNSVHPETGLIEYSCGPASDEHAGGWKQEDYREDYHKYLRVMGGFLSVTVERVDDIPTLTFRFHDVEGKVLLEQTHKPRTESK